MRVITLLLFSIVSASAESVVLSAGAGGYIGGNACISDSGTGPGWATCETITSIGDFATAMTASASAQSDYLALHNSFSATAADAWAETSSFASITDTVTVDVPFANGFLEPIYTAGIGGNLPWYDAPLPYLIFRWNSDGAGGWSIQGVDGFDPLNPVLIPFTSGQPITIVIDLCQACYYGGSGAELPAAGVIYESSSWFSLGGLEILDGSGTSYNGADAWSGTLPRLVTPEPGAWVLALTGLALMGLPPIVRVLKEARLWRAIAWIDRERINGHIDACETAAVVLMPGRVQVEGPFAPSTVVRVEEPAQASVASR